MTSDFRRTVRHTIPESQAHNETHHFGEPCHDGLRLDTLARALAASSESRLRSLNLLSSMRMQAEALVASLSTSPPNKHDLSLWIEMIAPTAILCDNTPDGASMACGTR